MWWSRGFGYKREFVLPPPPNFQKKFHTEAQNIKNRFILIIFSICVGLVFTEILLHIFNLPHFYKKHTYPPQFASMVLNNKDVFYVNTPSERIRFIYDGNPRGYFGKNNEIDHIINSSGFRGKEFSYYKPKNTFRIAFIGDSFTFGEGVWLKDTYPEKVSAMLSEKFKGSGIKFESYNFGVGGYNTVQELFLLKNIVLQSNPDMVVVGYVLNDTEEPLLRLDAIIGNIARKPVEESNFEGIDETRPPESFIFKSRIVKLIWKYFEKQKISRKTIAYYKSLYTKDSNGWENTRKALQEIIKTCKDRNISCYVVCFPVMYKLNNNYPFIFIHLALKREVQEDRGIFIDIFPMVKGRDATNLWVHPTDQHPNEIVHEIVAKAIVDRMAQDKDILKLTAKY